MWAMMEKFLILDSSVIDFYLADGVGAPLTQGAADIFINYTEFYRKSKLYVFPNMGETWEEERQKTPKALFFEKNIVKTLVKTGKTVYSLAVR